MIKILYVLVALLVILSFQGSIDTNNNENKNTDYQKVPLIERRGGASCDIKDENYEGVILTVINGDNWIPDKKIIDEFEKKLFPYIGGFKYKDENEVFCDENSLKFVKENIKKYKRQYVGILIGGRKVLYCNFLMVDNRDEMSERWRNEYINVYDGGADYFEIFYDIDFKTLYNFHIHGMG